MCENLKLTYLFFLQGCMYVFGEQLPFFFSQYYVGFSCLSFVPMLSIQYVCTCMHVCMLYVCMYVTMYVYMHVCMHVCMYVCMYYVCMYVCKLCMYVCMHVCMLQVRIYGTDT